MKHIGIRHYNKYLKKTLPYAASTLNAFGNNGQYEG